MTRHKGEGGGKKSLKEIGAAGWIYLKDNILDWSDIVVEVKVLKFFNLKTMHQFGLHPYMYISAKSWQCYHYKDC